MKLMCKPRRAPRTPWSADDDEVLRINYPHFPAYLVAYVLGREVGSIHNRAHILGLKKAPDFWSKPIAKLWAGGQHKEFRKHQFRKGHVPLNKGIRRPGWAPGRMATTQFKKGRPACESRNYVPIGTEKLDIKRNAIVRKVTDDPSVFPAQRWQPVAKLVWEAENGPVPAGHVVRFREGMKTLVTADITPDRLELVSLRENMKRNSIHNYPPELKRAMQMRGALTRTINRITRKQRTDP